MRGDRLEPPHPRALTRNLLSTTFGLLFLMGALSFFVGTWGLLAGALWPLLILDAWFDHRFQGWWVGDEHLISRAGWWNRTTRIVDLDKLQSLELVQDVFARRWGLAQLRIAGGGKCGRAAVAGLRPRAGPTARAVWADAGGCGSARRGRGHS